MLGRGFESHHLHEGTLLQASLFFYIYLMVKRITIRTEGLENIDWMSLDLKDSLENLVFQETPVTDLLAGQTLDIDPTVSSFLISSERLASSNYLQPGSLYFSLVGASYSGTGQWVDTTGGTVSADINGGASFSSVEGCFILDGTDDSISIPSDPRMGMSTTPFTIHVWVRVNQYPITNPAPIFGKISSSYEYDGYFLAANPNGTLKSFTNGAFRLQDVDSEATLVPGQWHMVTMITQLSGSPNTTLVYLDSDLVISTDHGLDTIYEDNIFYLGWAGPGVGLNHLVGDIGEVHFYERALTGNEVAANYRFTRPKYITEYL